MGHIKNILLLILGIVIGNLTSFWIIKIMGSEGVTSTIVFSFILAMILIIVDYRRKLNYSREVLPIFAMLLIIFIFYLYRNWDNSMFMYGTYKETKDFILRSRYIIVCQLVILFFFYIYGLLSQFLQSTPKPILSVLILIIAVGLNYIYVDREYRVKDEYIQQRWKFNQYCEYLRYYKQSSNVEPEGELVTGNIAIITEDMKNLAKNVDFTMLNTYIRNIELGEWQNSRNRIEKKLQTEIKGAERLLAAIEKIDKFAQLKDEEKLRLRNEVIEFCIQELNTFMNTESFVSYWGLYLQNNIPTLGAKCIQKIEHQLDERYCVGVE